jgi:DNA excision repair protein ERCC-2
MIWRRGDIHMRYDVNTRPEEGSAVQRRLQRDRSATYRREVQVSHRWQVDGRSFALSGRVDGCDLDAPVPLVEEFKTTRIDALALHACAGSVHLAQARLYAALLSDEKAADEWDVCVIYAHPDTLATHVVRERVTREELRAFRDQTCRGLTERVAALRRHRAARDAGLAVLDFPYETFRDSQRELARAVYRAVRDRSGLLAAAPTGTGKTMGTVFPSLKCAAEGHVDRVVYATARGTGQRAVVDALRRVHERVPLRYVTIAAKERVCFKDRPICDPDVCEYARGFHDRVPAALAELETIAEATTERIAAVARRHCVCPFELSLDASVTSDVVVCDYNYVFDPIVRLKRVHGFLGDRTALLIDEAHQLAPRVRDALSCRISRAAIRAARGKLASAALEVRRTALERRLAELCKQVEQDASCDPSAAGSAGVAGSFELEIETPAALLSAARGFLECWLDTPRARPVADEAEQLLFDVLRLLRAAEWHDGERFAWVLRRRSKEPSAARDGAHEELALDLECLDPSAHIAATLEDFRGNVRFSATLSPLALANRQHGAADGRVLSVSSPFPIEHLAVLIVPDVPVRYRERARGVDALGRVIADVSDSRPGNYLVAAPSFEYLTMIADQVAQQRPATRVLRQRAYMPDAERAAFVAALATRSTEPLLAFVVLGGVFAESIDLSDGVLNGIVVAGVGLAPPSGALDRIQRRFCDDGYDVAYRQPAMTRVVQAAGRLIRSERDRGVVCLVDARYLQDGFQQYFPAHWRPETVRASMLSSRLSEFWSGDRPEADHGRAGARL